MVLSEDEKSDTEDQEETELGVMEDQRSVILHLISQLKLGMDLTKVGGRVPRDLWPVIWAPCFPPRLPCQAWMPQGWLERLFLFVCLTASHSMWDLSSLIRD